MWPLALVIGSDSSLAKATPRVNTITKMMLDFLVLDTVRVPATTSLRRRFEWAHPITAIAQPTTTGRAMRIHVSSGNPKPYSAKGSAIGVRISAQRSMTRPFYDYRIFAKSP